MANFNEHSLEMSIMELFQDEGYIYLNGEQIHRERSEVLLVDDLRKYLLNRYAAEGLTASEVDSIVLRLRSISGTIYEANKAVCKMICDGFIFNREDHTKKDIYIELIDFDEPEKNVFKIVNQFEIEGVNNQLRIPDGIVFINGIPVVVLEFKSAVKENTTIMDAYTQLTVRYRRDIPELFKYNAFIVISDGANNFSSTVEKKEGSKLFTMPGKSLFASLKAHVSIKIRVIRFSSFIFVSLPAALLV